MKVERFVTGIISTNCYLAINEDTRQAVVVDPAACPSYLLSHIKSEGIKIEALLLTHAHFDHIMGIDGFVDEFHVPVYVYEEDADAMTDPKLNQSSVYTGGYTYEGARSIREGQILKLAGYDFEVFHTPGHTKADAAIMSGPKASYSAGIRCSRIRSGVRIFQAEACPTWCGP